MKKIDPEAYGMDCRSGASKYPAGQLASVLPPPVKKRQPAAKAA